MKTRPKDIGTRFTSDVIRYLRPNGFPHAELRNQAGEHDKGDIIGCIGVAIECKGGKAAEDASDAKILDWLLRETENERVNAGADVGILVTKRRAIGATRAGEWWAHMTLDTLYYLVLDTDRDDRCLPSRGIGLRPIRMHLADAVMLLRQGGFGSPLEAAA